LKKDLRSGQGPIEKRDDGLLREKGAFCRDKGETSIEGEDLRRAGIVGGRIVFSEVSKN